MSCRLHPFEGGPKRSDPILGVLSAVVGKIALACVLLGLFASTRASAELARAFFNITPERGLASPNVRAVHYGRSGFLWVGTLDGLQRFDGHAFRDLRPSRNDPGGASSHIVGALLEDSAGQLWIGTDFEPVFRFDLASEEFLAFRPDPGHDWSEDLMTRHLVEDDDGVLWLATTTGLARWDRSSGAFDFYRGDPEAPEGLPHDELMRLAEDGRGGLWIATWGGGVVRFDLGTRTFSSYRHDPANPESLSHDFVYSLAFGAEGALWVATYGGGLSRLDPGRESFTRFRHDPGDAQSLGSDFVTSLAISADQQLWAGTAGGGLAHLDLAHLSRTGEALFEHFTNAGGWGSLPGDTVNDLELDELGRLWISTSGGLSVLDLQRSPLEQYRHDPLDSDTIGPGTVMSVLEDPDGSLWVGTLDAGLSRVDRETGAVTHYRSVADDPKSLSENKIRRLLLDPLGNLWVSTTRGLNRFDRGSDSFVRYLNDPHDPTSLASDWITDLDSDDLGQIWLATYAGLDRLDPATGAIDHVLDGSAAARVPVFTVAVVGGKVWAGTHQDGLLVVDDDGVSQLRHDGEDPRTLSSDSIAQIVEDLRGRIWIASTAGLDLFDAESMEIEASYVTDSESPAAVFAVTEDGAGKLWLNTQRGLFRFDPESGSMEVYGREDGLCCHSYLWASASTRSGEILVGGDGGLSAFRPADLEFPEFVPRVLLTGLKINGQRVPIGAGSRLDKALHQTRDLELFHTDHVVSVEFAGLGGVLTDRKRYRYRLEGFQDQWVDVGPEARAATFTNLPAGDYLLEVQAGTTGGSWAEDAAASLAVTVVAPWWERLSFRLLVLLAVVGAALLAYRMRTRRMAQRNLELSGEVERRRLAEDELRQEMHQRSLAETEGRRQRAALAHATRVSTLGELAASLAHELNQPLTGVVSNAQAAERFLRAADPDLDEAKAALRDIAADGRRAGAVIQNMRSLLRKDTDHRRPVDVRELILASEKLIHSELILRQIDSHLDLDEGLTVEADPVQLQQVIMNLVLNAFEALEGVEDRVNRISIAARRAGGDVLIEVSDSGTGFDQEGLGRLFELFHTTKSTGLGLGLAICKSIVESHDGRLWVSETSSAGTTFSLRLPAASGSETGRAAESAVASSRAGVAGRE